VHHMMMLYVKYLHPLNCFFIEEDIQVYKPSNPNGGPFSTTQCMTCMTHVYQAILRVKYLSSWHNSRTKEYFFKKGLPVRYFKNK
jgi:hypothetical protein